MDKIQKKLDDIYNDLENNVTKIYQRRELMITYDLVWHSVLQFEFMGTMLSRGWVECIAIGDTRCGKTKTAERLLRHYRAGEMGAGENTSLAGLIGGMQQISRQWSIVWGKFPRNDGRLVVIDEASNLPIKVLPEFATIRSEGIARITKIQTEQTRSRTRAIWISNPRVDQAGRTRTINAYDYGVLTIPELIGRQADIARFDLGCVVRSGDVSEDVIFDTDRKRVEHRYNSDACHGLIMWAWSRKPEHVNISRECEQEIILQSKGLARKYHDSIPLVKLEEQPEKLARLSVALATRLFSTSDGNDVVVLPDHVAYVVGVLNRLYTDPGMGYDLYSKKLFATETLPDPEKVKKRLTEYGREFVDGILSYDVIRYNTIEDLTGLDRDGGRAMVSFLVRKKCLRPEHTWYRKTIPFIRLLKRIDSGKESLGKKKEVEF